LHTKSPEYSQRAGDVVDHNNYSFLHKNLYSVNFYFSRITYIFIIRRGKTMFQAVPM